MNTFQNQIETLYELLDEAANNLATLGLQNTIEELNDAARRQEFRISVFGRFKHGKSSVINALLGEKISPSAILPCTSTLIEFRHGDKHSFYRSNRSDTIESTQKEFEKSVTIKNSKNVESTDYWKVTLPIKWLGDHFVLVDTPGTNEDKIRLEISNNELKNTDSALLIFRADQLGSIEDLDQVEEIKSRVGCVIILVNRIDLIPQKDRLRTIEYARKIVTPLGIPSERVLPFSAIQILDGVPESLNLLDQIRELISKTLISDVGGAKLLSLLQRTRKVIDDVEPKMGEIIDHAQEKFQNIYRKTEMSKKHLHSHESISAQVNAIMQKHGNKASNDSAEALTNEWGNILKKLKSRRTGWYSDRSPLFSPKAFAQEIAEDAKYDLQGIVEKAVRSKIQPILNSHMDDAQNEIKPVVHDLLLMISDSDMESIENIERQLLGKVTEEAFGKSINAAEAGPEAAVTAVVSGIVGYVIADIILFYIMGAISGFLNPVLLAAAATAGVAAYLFMGKDAVKTWICDKIADKLDEELSSSKVINKISSSINDKTKELFIKLAEEYSRQLDKLITKAHKDYAKNSEQLEKEQRKRTDILKQKEDAQKSLHDIISFLQKQINILEESRGDLCRSN